MTDKQMWLTTDELAERLRLKPNTIHKWRQANKGPAYHLMEGSIRYHVNDVEEFERSRKAVPDA